MTAPEGSSPASTAWAMALGLDESIPAYQPHNAVPKKAIASAWRPDIEGLRAVAVGLVIADHFYGKPSGGFIGVDVFFVISGFLITSLLLRDDDRRGRISFLKFYAHRAQRILPAAVVVLIATAVVAKLLFLDVRYRQTLSDAKWSLGFAANIHFADLGTNYFDLTRPQSPLQHYWSLGVEEQYYVVWPLVLFLVLAVAKRFRRRGAIPAALILLTAGIAWSAHLSNAEPVSAYFSSVARAWELLAGATLSVLAAGVARLPRWTMALAGWLGLGVICAGAFVTGPATQFPWPGAVLPVAGTVLFIAAGAVVSGAGTAAWFIANPLFRFIGRISFSLYLWHWPAVIFARAAFRDGSSAREIVPVAATVALSLASYYLVERAVLDAAAHRRARRAGEPHIRAPRRERRARRNERRVSFALASVGALVCVGAVASYPTNQAVAPLVALPVFVAADSPPAPEPSGSGDTDTVAPSIAATPPPLSASDLVAAVNASSWPSPVRAEFNSLGGAGAPEWIKDQCLDVDAANLARCQYGATRPTHTALLLGDSKAISYLPGLLAALAPAGWRIQVLTWDRCPVALLDVGTGGSEAADCHNHHTYLRAELPKLHPQLVIMADNNGIMPRVGGANPFQTMSTALTATIALLPQTARRVIVSDPPGSKNLQSCVTATSGPRDCMGTKTKAWQSYYAMQVAVGVLTHTPVLDLENQFCYQRFCPAVIKDQPVYFDGAHLTEAYSRSLAPVWASYLGITH